MNLMNRPNMTPYTTPAPRSNVTTATLIGALASAVVKTTVNMKKMKENDMTPTEAAFDTAKGTLQGAIATATVASVNESLSGPNRSVLNALTKTAVGVTAVYAVEKASDKLRTNLPVVAPTEADDETEA